MLQSSNRAENRLDLAGKVVFGEAEVPECFEFSERVKLQLVGKCKTFEEDSGDIAGVCAVVAFVEDAVLGRGTVIDIQRCDGGRVLRRNSIVGVTVVPFLEFK